VRINSFSVFIFILFLFYKFTNLQIIYYLNNHRIPGQGRVRVLIKRPERARSRDETRRDETLSCLFHFLNFSPNYRIPVLALVPIPCSAPSTISRFVGAPPYKVPSTFPFPSPSYRLTRSSSLLLALTTSIFIIHACPCPLLRCFQPLT